MNATILCVGTELLFGQIVNTNAAWLSQRLQMMGINVLYHQVVGDNAERLKASLNRALAETELVITSGGLGPTQDDITKEMIADVMGDTLVAHTDVLERIESFFKSIGMEMTDNNRKQALLPARSTIFHNDAGTAPGFALESQSPDGAIKTIIALPGPPRELMRMFDRQALPYLERRTDSVIYYKLLRFYGIGESALETALSDLIDGQTDPTVATYAKEGECSLRIASKRRTQAEAAAAVDDMVEKVRMRVGQYLYSETDKDLALVVAEKLIEKGLSIASAESCTGGLFAAGLIDISGISEIFRQGWITYSNASKTALLGVPEALIAEHGAVSKAVAVAMAHGARERAGSHLAVSVTGIAGPEGGSADKPVGTAWVAVSAVAPDGAVIHRTKHFVNRDRGRNWNRRVFALAMMHQVYELLKENIW
jgi:nicotinamide-nucleotide amidase